MLCSGKSQVTVLTPLVTLWVICPPPFSALSCNTSAGWVPIILQIVFHHRVISHVIMKISLDHFKFHVRCPAFILKFSPIWWEIWLLVGYLIYMFDTKSSQITFIPLKANSDEVNFYHYLHNCDHIKLFRVKSLSHEQNSCFTVNVK